jgi:hypothetical protein
VVRAGVDHAVQPPAEIEVTRFVQPGDIAQGTPAVGVGVLGDHGGAPDGELTAARRLAGHGPHAELDAVDRPAAAGGEGGVAGGDTGVVVDTEHGGGNRQGQDAPPQPEPTHMSWLPQHAASAARLDADDALTCNVGAEVRGFEPLTSSVRVSGGLPLCRPAFPQVASDRQGQS